ncbi:f-box domain protein [Neofusicoccum parvum]|uniref:F-box domain protein n=1 Tax=Neofusicoccum parvum TaxID=310453 RepID=A0ACB5SNF0_9PEZI|nr:f-box domain protein [Neofusicoccum parvum]
MPTQTSSNHIASQQHNQRKSSRPQQQKHLPQRTPSQRFIAPDAAEHVIVSILERVRSLDDLFALARVNRGFYRVFKRNELRVLRVVLQNESPSAWEHRETSPPYTGTDQPNPDSAHPEPEYTPTTFYRHHMRDTYIIAALKSLVLTRCQSFLRPETVMALASSHAARSARVENAFWRIWTFCKIFGSGKGREDDIVGQMDWLRGGPLVHQTGIRATIMTSDSFDASSALLNAPDHFAKGNGENGLSAEELYDMTEIWTCMGVLISGLEGRTEQAREFGVYEATDVRGGDIDGEENMLQEWVYYLTTLGLSTILELATASTSTDPSAFIRALESGWMNWSPPQLDGSRRTFLKEAVARVYEEKIATMAASTPQDDRAAMKQVMRQRIAAHKAEIRTRRRTGDCLLVRMSMERPMSEWEGVFDRLGGSDENLSQPQPHRHASASSSSIGGAPAPAPALPSVARRQSELIALPRMPELPAGTPTRPSFPELPAMQERNTDPTTANPLLQTLAQSKQYDYGSPVETHPALRSFLESDASSRRSSESSIVSRPSPTTNTRHFSEEAVHPAFRNRAPTTTTTTTRSSRQQQRQPHSSSSSVSSISGGGASSFLSNTTPPTTANTTPHLSSHASSMHHCPAPPGGMPPSYSHLPPSYNQAAQAHQAPSAFPHAPAHPSYPTAYHGPTGGAHHSHHSSSSSSASRPRPADPSSPASPTSFLPAHRKRASAQHPFQHAMLAAAATPNAAANTADKAIFRIVEMGFTAEDAKHALMKTDLGDGLRVDRAVELLLRR